MLAPAFASTGAVHKIQCTWSHGHEGPVKPSCNAYHRRERRAARTPCTLVALNARFVASIPAILTGDRGTGSKAAMHIKARAGIPPEAIGLRQSRFSSARGTGQCSDTSPLMPTYPAQCSTCTVQQPSGPANMNLRDNTGMRAGVAWPNCACLYMSFAGVMRRQDKVNTRRWAFRGGAERWLAMRRGYREPLEGRVVKPSTWHWARSVRAG
jgi:hypothetical protein